MKTLYWVIILVAAGYAIFCALCFYEIACDWARKLFRKDKK